MFLIKFNKRNTVLLKVTNYTEFTQNSFSYELIYP